MTPREDTIFALSSAPGRAGVAVVRISGEMVLSALKTLTKRGNIPSKIVVYSPLYNNNEQLIDRGIVLWFPAPRSFTGEAMAELQVHGGRSVIEGVLEALAD
ncbi:MAG: tRNA uridine-5-carboxymethylaminomethyl(34) synthesis GTPase MnmE, partial [Pseudomonadota bacterium]